MASVLQYIAERFCTLVNKIIKIIGWGGGDRAVGPWSDLPRDVLECIANNLDLIELLRFRSVCKDWKFASSNATSEIGSRNPWFLAIDKPLCIFMRDSSCRVHKISIPELCNATTCVGSNYGWLLLLKGSSMFFFCPFSRAKIQLPLFPSHESPNLVAAFSSPPTCKDCIVSVICKSHDGNYFKIHVLQRGASSWTMHRLVRQPSAVDTFTGAAYLKKRFYFFDRGQGVIFSLRDKKLKSFRIIKPTKDSLKGLYVLTDYYGMVKYLKLIESAFKNVSVSACGTVIVDDSGANNVLRNHEKINMGANRMLKGVWVHPRFFELSPEQSIW